MNKQQITITTSFFLVLTMLFSLLTAKETQAAQCHTFDNTKPIPVTRDGYQFGAAYNLFSTQRELLLKTTCTQTNNNIEIGSGENQFIYKYGYVNKNNAWEPVTFSGQASDYAGFLKSPAQITLPATTPQQNPAYFIAYTCTKQNAEWKCGCRDQACANKTWQLQGFQAGGNTGGSGGNTAIYHKGDFLTNPSCMSKNTGTTFYPNAPANDRATCRQSIKSKGYTHHYISITSEVKDFYSQPDTFNGFLQELRNEGIKPVVWLTSDTGNWRNKSINAIKTDLQAYIPKIDQNVDSYILGIEVDEYWNQNEVNEIGTLMQTLTQKPVGVHMLIGKWSYCKASWCDFMALQYGWNLSENQIKDMTRRAKSELNKPVVAAEYSWLEEGGSESESIRLGNAAVAAGAAGFGNGGTP